MFTGLIEATGTVKRVTPRGPGLHLSIGAPRALVAELALGESVAVDGACLTVTAAAGDVFAADASMETVSRSTLCERRAGDPLHLERALRLSDRLGGHLVAGHVDAVGTVRAVRPVGEVLSFTFDAPEAVSRYLVPKGSVAVDGVSLTVNTVDGGTFSVVLIPHTQGVVHLHRKRPGERVNLEADLLGKYVERLLRAGRSEGGVDLELLARNGFVE